MPLIWLMRSSKYLWAARTRQAELKAIDGGKACWCTRVCFIHDSMRHSRRALLYEAPKNYLTRARWLLKRRGIEVRMVFLIRSEREEHADEEGADRFGELRLRLQRDIVRILLEHDIGHGRLHERLGDSRADCQAIGTDEDLALGAVHGIRGEGISVLLGGKARRHRRSRF